MILPIGEKTIRSKETKSGRRIFFVNRSEPILFFNNAKAEDLVRASIPTAASGAKQK